MLAFQSESGTGWKGGVMRQYHLYYLRDNMLVGSDRIEAADDEQAARIARERGDGQAVEVWNAHSRVRVVTPAAAASASR